MKKKIAINGAGRIGRLTAKLIIDDDNLDLAVINSPADSSTVSHLLKYDSTHGAYKKNEISFTENEIIVGGKHIKYTREKDPSKLPWSKFDIDIVLECSGFFTTKAMMEKHLHAGAKKVILSAPCKNEIPTIIIGVNDHEILKTHSLISASSCTTNCLAPIAKILNDNFTIKQSYVTTIHSITTDQRLLDNSHSDLRRARSAIRSIVPTKTGAAESIAKVIPSLENKIFANAMRVPVDNVSCIDMVATLDKSVSVNEVNLAVKNAADNHMKKIVEYIDEPLVSIDICGNLHSAVFDSTLTAANNKFIKVIAWYDNELAYSKRICELAYKMLSA